MESDAAEFYNSHSPQFLIMAIKQDEREIPVNPDGYGKRTGGCGNTVEIYLSVADQMIRPVNFQVHGCINTKACCNTLVDLAQRHSIEDAWKIIPENIADFLATLPADHVHCTELTTSAFYLAQNNYQERCAKE